MSHEPYFIHPNPIKEHMVCTPDGGILECKHEAAAKRVCATLNEMHVALEFFRAQERQRVQWFPASTEPAFRGVYLRKHPMGSEHRSYWNGMFWCVGESLTPSDAQNLEWRNFPEVPHG